MIRKILVPTQTRLEIILPDSYVGKHVEILAFDLNTEEVKSEGTKPRFRELLKGFRFNSGGYIFNRKEANDYD